jgi:predicted metal-dependent hydrolase
VQSIVQTLLLEDIGEVKFKRSVRSRAIRIRVDHKEGVTVIMPVYSTEKNALRFVYEKKNWIRKSLKRQEDIRNQQTIFTETSIFTTRMHSLYMFRHNKNTVKSVVSGDKIVIWFPSYADVTDNRIQTVVRRAIFEAWRIEAKKYLPGRIAVLAKQFNYKYSNISLKNTKSRWGSCSATNNINLNIQLMRLSDRLIDYVILHELTHTQYKNHQQSFWNRMEAILPGARKLDKELNKYHLEYW